MAFFCNLQMFSQGIYQKLQKNLVFSVFRDKITKNKGIFIILSFSIQYQSFSIKTVA